MSELEPGKIALLIDDNLMSSMRVKAQLQGQGYSVSVVKAAPVEGTVAPDLIVINIGSRGIDGIAIGAACKLRFPECSLQGFCGHLEVDRRRAAKTAGFDKLLTNEQALSGLG